MAVPLVVIDVYEHAFYIDYHNRKSEYVEKFMDHIDWDDVKGDHLSVKLGAIKAVLDRAGIDRKVQRELPEEVSIQFAIPNQSNRPALGVEAEDGEQF